MFPVGFVRVLVPLSTADTGEIRKTFFFLSSSLISPLFSHFRSRQGVLLTGLAHRRWFPVPSGRFVFLRGRNGPRSESRGIQSRKDSPLTTEMIRVLLSGKRRGGSERVAGQRLAVRPALPIWTSWPVPGSFRPTSRIKPSALSNANDTTTEEEPIFFCVSILLKILR